MIADDVLIQEVAIRWFLHDLEPSKRDDRSIWDTQPDEIREVFLKKAEAFLTKPSDYDIHYREASHRFPVLEGNVHHIHRLAEDLLRHTAPLQDAFKQIRKAN